ncbi:MAG: hypothetical protein IJP31_01370 [Lachnospiraceae bacterium]|nr:hypothetical protein [Lachnospiraceae bacterium]
MKRGQNMGIRRRAAIAVAVLCLALLGIGCGSKENGKSEAEANGAVAEESKEEAATPDLQTMEEVSNAETVPATEEETLTPVFKEEDWQFILCDYWNNDLPFFGFNFREVPDEIEFHGITAGSESYKFYEEKITLPDSLESRQYSLYFYDYKYPLSRKGDANLRNPYAIVVRQMPPNDPVDTSMDEKKADLNTYWGMAEVYYEEESDTEYAILNIESIESLTGKYVVRISCSPMLQAAEIQYRGYLEKRLPAMLTPTSEEAISSSEDEIPAVESEEGNSQD